MEEVHGRAGGRRFPERGRGGKTHPVVDRELREEERNRPSIREVQGGCPAVARGNASEQVRKTLPIRREAIRRHACGLQGPLVKEKKELAGARGEQANPVFPRILSREQTGAHRPEIVIQGLPEIPLSVEGHHVSETGRIAVLREQREQGGPRVRDRGLGVGESRPKNHRCGFFGRGNLSLLDAHLGEPHSELLLETVAGDGVAELPHVASSLRPERNLHGSREPRRWSGPMRRAKKRVGTFLGFDEPLLPHLPHDPMHGGGADLEPARPFPVRR